MDTTNQTQTQICNICHTPGQYFIKICTCSQSRVCTDCYVNLHTFQYNRCPLCRSDLTFNYHTDYKKFCNNLFYYFLHVFIIVIIECIIPVLYFSTETSRTRTNNKDNVAQWLSEEENIIIVTCICVFVLQPITIILLNYINNIFIENCIQNQKNTIKTICIIQFIIENVLFIFVKHDVAWLFFMLVLFPLYICTCMVIIFLIIVYYLYIHIRAIKLAITQRRIAPIINQTLSVNNFD